MKITLRPLLSLCLLSAFYLLFAPAALAWPFVQRTGTYAASATYGSGLEGSLRQTLAIQLDTDRPLEMFGGGLLLQQTVANPQGQLIHSTVPLPLPDKDPYAANDSQVNFESGGGDAGDIDGDGDTDLIYSALLLYGTISEGVESKNVRIMACRNNGDGTWTRLWQLKDVNAPTAGAPEVKLADLDRDGDLDLIETYNGLRIRWNPGDGNFNGAPTVLRATVFPTAPDLEVADFDGNGWPDILVMAQVVPNPNQPLNKTGRIELLSNTGGVFTTAVVPATPGREDYGPSAVADLDADGKPDLISFEFAPYAMVWRRNTGSGFLAPVTLQSMVNTPGFLPGDMNEDGIVDIVMSYGDGGAQWLRGLGNGAFAAASVLIPAVNPTAGPLTDINLADRDGDGDLDITLTGLFYENTAPHKKAGVRVEEWSGSNPTGAAALAVGDVNNDGKADLVVTDPGAPIARLRWYAGNGNGLNAPSTLSTNALIPLDVTTGDFNGDSRTDLAWTTAGILTQALSTSANGSTWTTSNIANMSGITNILADDMDRDGDTDILSISPSAGIIRIHSNNGTGSSWLPQNVDTGLTNVSALAAGQLLPGGRPEIATLLSGGFFYQHHYTSSWNDFDIANSLGATASRAVLIAELDDNQPGAETFFSLNNNAIQYMSNGTPVTLTTSAQPVNRLAAADWDADGLNDLLVATAGGVDLYPSSRATTAGDHPLNTFPIPLFSGASIRDLVIMDLNGDSFPDAVAVESSGQLQLLYNRSATLRIGVTGNSTQSLTPGASGIAAGVTGTHLPSLGIPMGSPVAPSRITARFRRSEVVGGVDTPGTTLSNAEVAALVESISILSGASQVLQTETPSTISGEHILVLSTAARQALTTGFNNLPSQFQIRLKLKPTAASSAVQRFFVDYFPESSRWAALDTAGVSDISPVRLIDGQSYPGTLFVVSAPSALDTWRFTNFNTYDATGPAANDADPDGDGNSNLVEYVMGQSPTSSGGIGASSPIGLTPGGLNTALIADLRLLTTYDSKVRLTLQQSTSLNTWTTLSTRTGTGAWTGTVPTTTSLSGGRTRFNFNTGAIPATTPKYFLRLVAEELP
jgi:FG-GAP-like repeat